MNESPFSVSTGFMQGYQNDTNNLEGQNYSNYLHFPDGFPDYQNWLPMTFVYYHPSEVILITCIMPLMLAIGLLGNVAFLFVVFRVRWMRTVVNFYLINLAAADIIFLCVAIGEKIGLFVNSPDVYNEAAKGVAGCLLISFIKGWCYFTSITLVTLVSVGRFYAVCRPHDYKLNSKQRALKLIAAAWTLCCIVSTLLLPAKSTLVKTHYIYTDDVKSLSDELLFDMLLNPPHVEMCRPIADLHWVAYVTDGLQALPFLLAMTGNIVIYVSIFRALNDRVSKSTRQNSRERKTEMRDKVSRMLIANGTIFFLCLAPFEVTSLWAMFKKEGLRGDTSRNRTWPQFCRVMMYLNSAINPVIYNVTNPRYRQAFVRAFSRKQDRRHETKSPSTVQLTHLRGESQESKARKDASHSQSHSQ